MDFVNQIVCGDCLDVMGQMPDGCVDLVFADPPFNVGKSTLQFKNRKDISTDFHWDRFDSNAKYLTWSEAWIKEVVRLVAPFGSLLIWIRIENVSYIKAMYEAAGMTHKASIIWHKTNPAPQVRKRNYLSSFETLLWAIKDSGQFVLNWKTQAEMHNFIETPLCMGNERLEHPSQKREDVAQHFIEIHSNEGDLVFDPFMGSGTTAVAADRLGRKFFGCDISKEYVELALNRLAEDRLKRSQLEMAL